MSGRPRAKQRHRNALGAIKLVAAATIADEEDHAAVLSSDETDPAQLCMMAIGTERHTREAVGILGVRNQRTVDSTVES